MLYSEEQKGIYGLYCKSTANISWRIDLLPPMSGVGQTQIFPFFGGPRGGDFEWDKL
jgi:hypothetical protein